MPRPTLFPHWHTTRAAAVTATPQHISHFSSGFNIPLGSWLLKNFVLCSLFSLCFVCARCIRIHQKRRFFCDGAREVEKKCRTTKSKWNKDENGQCFGRKKKNSSSIGFLSRSQSLLADVFCSLHFFSLSLVRFAFVDYIVLHIFMSGFFLQHFFVQFY